MFDRTNFGPLNISLPKNCTCQTNDDVEKQDCTAHSILYDIISNTFRPLMVKTDTWCSSRFIDKIWHPVQSSNYHGEDHAIYLFTLYNNDSGCTGLSSMVILQIRGDTLPANFYLTIRSLLLAANEFLLTSFILGKIHYRLVFTLVY